MPITPVAPPSVTRRLHRHVTSRRLNRHVNYASCTAIGYPHRDADQLWRTHQWRGQSRMATRRRTLTRSGLGRGRGWAGNAKGNKNPQMHAPTYPPARLHYRCFPCFRGASVLCRTAARRAPRHARLPTDVVSGRPLYIPLSDRSQNRNFFVC